MTNKELSIGKPIDNSTDNSFIKVLEEDGLTEQAEVRFLKESLNAYKVTRDGDRVPDNTVRLEALKLLMKLKGRLAEKEKTNNINTQAIYVLKYDS